MKHTFKKILAVILAAATLLCCAPLSGLAEIDLPDISKFFVSKAKAVEASDLPEDFDLPLYNVSRIFSDSNNVGGSLKTFSENFINLSLAKKVYNAAAENAGFVASIEAWEAIRLVSNPSNLAEYLKYQQQYEEVIFAVLFSALKNEKFEEFSYSNGISKITSLTNKIITSGKNAELLDKTSLDGTERKELIDTAFAFLTEGKDVESKWSALGEYTDIVNKYNSIVDDIAEGIVSAINIIDSVSMYVSMLDAGAEVLSYLNALKAKAPNSVFGGAVQTVINTISKEWLGVVEKTIIDVGFVFGIPATEKLIDYAWTGCSAMCPFLGGMTIGEAAGTIACNLLFATEDTIEQYEYLKILTQLETAACALYDGYFNSCKSSVNRENAAMLMFSCDFSHALYGVATEASVEMMNILCNKGIVNTVINIFNNKYKQTFDEFEEASNTLLNAEKNVYNMIKSFWKTCIEEDYPEYFGVLEEENITPKYINSVDIEKDEVVFRVGDAMYFKWNINPTNHEGEIGLKSDNEAVIKSREPMGILPLALEENIGTANVTIYSVDNPEICDTIKITVIGENDEGTTEAEQNIVSGTCGELTWTINKNTGRLVLNGTGPMCGYFHDYGRSPWNNYGGYIKTAVIGDGVTKIDGYAFEYCGNLTQVIIGDGVTNIGGYAFYKCHRLKNIKIGKSVTGIGANAFVDCNSITNVYYSGDIASWCDIYFEYNSHPILQKTNFYIDGKLVDTLDIPNSVTSIGKYAFANCNSLTSITIPDSVTTIGDAAFGGCTNLANVTIPDSVTNIGEEAFCGCTSLANITIPNSVTNIGSHVFGDCDSLTNITIGNSVASIGEDAFWNCDSLTNITIGNSVASIGKRAFWECDSLTSITIPDSVKSIEEQAFYDCDSLESIIIGNNLASIGEQAFMSCDSLISITIPDSVISIGNKAFYCCNGLTRVTIGNGVTNIGAFAFCSCDSLTCVTIGNSVISLSDSVFSGCSSLTSITIPNSVTSIGHNAFGGCVSLANLTIPDSVISIGSRAFEHCYSLTSIIISDNVLSIGKDSFRGCNNLISITVDSANPVYSSDKYGVCFNRDKTTLIQYPAGNTRTSYIIPESVKNIGDEAFYSCSSLTSLKIPDSVTSIGYGAFVCCNNLTNVEIGNGITIISNGTFGCCDNLTSIVIGNGVTNIGTGAFNECNKIKDVYYKGTESEWNSIRIDMLNGSFISARIHFNYISNSLHYISSTTKPATCSEEGIMSYSCECGYSYTEPIPKTTHTNGSWVISIEPSCTKNGEKIAHCTVCGTICANDVAPALGHTAGAWETIIEPTTETEGKKIKKCIICDDIVEESAIEKLIKDGTVVSSPSTATISYGDSILLHVDASKIPEGGRVEWTASNNNFSWSADGDTCKISPKSSGDTTFTATIYDAEGNPVSIDEQTMTSKAGFFDKIIAFFKSLFGLTKTYENVYKGIIR